MIIEATPSIYIKPSLNDAVEEWIKAGGQVKTNFDKSIKPVAFNISDNYKGRHTQVAGDFKERVLLQQPILKRYQEVSKIRTCWHDLSVALNKVVSASHLGRAARGATSIQNAEVWEKVKAYAEMKIAEFENEKKISEA